MFRVLCLGFTVLSEVDGQRSCALYICTARMYRLFARSTVLMYRLLKSCLNVQATCKKYCADVQAAQELLECTGYLQEVMR
jgi:hypothetical protein